MITHDSVVEIWTLLMNHKLGLFKLNPVFEPCLCKSILLILGLLKTPVILDFTCFS